jgi:hypothetical protein
MAILCLVWDPNNAHGNETERWPERSFQQSIYVYREVWERFLTQTALAFSLAVVLPVPLDTSAAAKVGTHLRDAIHKVNEGEYEDAATAARRAIDDLGTAWPSGSQSFRHPGSRDWRERATSDGAWQAVALGCAASAVSGGACLEAPFDRRRQGSRRRSRPRGDVQHGLTPHNRLVRCPRDEPPQVSERVGVGDGLAERLSALEHQPAAEEVEAVIRAPG